jgi:hypothetical protein
LFVRNSAIDGLVSYISNFREGILSYRELGALGFEVGIVVDTSYHAILWCLVFWTFPGGDKFLLALAGGKLLIWRGQALGWI